MKITTLKVLILLLFTSDYAIAGGGKVLRSGKGSISVKGLDNKEWPEGYSYKRKEGPYKREQIKKPGMPKQDKSVLETWNPSNFTSPCSLKEGEELKKFKFLVHGLELKHLVKGLNEMSFDDFIIQQLNKEVPGGDDFIRFYPYFFHKKTIISASVISENLTATFGTAGFILTVPEANLLFGDDKDVHTPTDKMFYQPPPPDIDSSTLGGFLVKERAKEFPLPKLNALLPKAPSATQPSSMVEKTTYQSKKAYQEEIMSKVTEEDIIASLESEGIKDRDPAKIQNALRIARQGLAALMPQIDAAEGKVSYTADGKIEKKVTKSSYNEVALLPIGQDSQPVTITGIFLRTSQEKLEEFMSSASIKKLREVAEAFDLPIIFIDDGNVYDTAL